MATYQVKFEWKCEKCSTENVLSLTRQNVDGVDATFKQPCCGCKNEVILSFHASQHERKWG